jgi:amylosucrase
VAGEPGYREMCLIYPDRTEPDAYERTLHEVFPDIAPGSFTQVPGLGWVWTSFHEYQWDLNYANPAVFRAMLGTMLALANRGIDVLRLDAVPFLWKRMGTDCQNQPEAHLLLQAFRALTRLAAPGLVLKAEAIVSPEMLAQYLGAHDRFRPECDLAYDNQLMVMLWSSLATRDVRLAERALARRRPAPAPTSWVTYARCRSRPGIPPVWSPGSGGLSRSTPSPSPSAASRSSTWGTNWPCTATRAGPRTRRTRTTTGGCTGR